MRFASSVVFKSAWSHRGHGIAKAAFVELPGRGERLLPSRQMCCKSALPILSISLLAVTASFAMPSVAHAKTPYGVWVDHTGRGAVEVKPCGSRLCGVIVWARKAADARRGCGRKLLGGLRKVGPNAWDNGWIIAPDSGSKYDLAIKPIGRNRLEILGYAGSKLFSKTMVWKRAPASLKRCDEPKIPRQILAKAETAPPKRPSGVGAPGVPLVPEAALRTPVKPSAAPVSSPSQRQALRPDPASSSSVRVERIQNEDQPPRIVYYDPPQSAPPPPRNPVAGSMMAQLALETSGLGVGRRDLNGLTRDGIGNGRHGDLTGTSDLVPPRPRLAQRPVLAQRPIEVSRVADDILVEIRNASTQAPSACRIHAPFVVSSIPCAR
ncbi:MAG: DUF2147 domain-containing protein [Pseudomonadota bacterium]